MELTITRKELEEGQKNFEKLELKDKGIELFAEWFFAIAVEPKEEN